MIIDYSKSNEEAKNWSKKFYGAGFTSYGSDNKLHEKENVFKEYVNWVVPSNEINLGFESKGLAENGGVKLLLKLWRKKKVILKSDLIIFPAKPVLIAGPEWKDGQLIFVLEIKEKK